MCIVDYVVDAMCVLYELVLVWNARGYLQGADTVLFSENSRA